MAAGAGEPGAGRTAPGSVALVSTNGLDPREGRALWSEAISSQYCELDLHVPRPSQRFDGSLFSRPVGGLDFTWMMSAPHTVVRSPAMIASDGRQDFLLCLVTQGYAEVTQDGRTCRLRDGAVTVLDCDRPFEFRLPHDFEQVVVRVPRERMLARLPESTLAGTTACAVPGRSGIGGMLSQFVQQVPRLDPASVRRSSPVLVGSTLDLLVEALTAGPAVTGTTQQARLRDLQRAKAALREGLHDAERSMTQVCRELGMSQRHLQTLFAEAGTTPSAWLVRERIGRAGQLLRTTDLTAEDIARRCGFRDYSHFHRTFRRQVGMTPGAFRKAPEPHA
ncbi:AraC family transcriptional regulator [Pseudonocardia kujensis]|uniref:AraC family transcriptional regulator n=1 Tax=Pseudonocardia kujensis TaxID=1128675 RepID=UPI001E38FBE5|nr:AraC family transcriptional regulator [Pseudonocardia kujensis]MCE0765770.1 AraC family transcriptional regulator [Pseudonocardia kujensis]